MASALCLAGEKVTAEVNLKLVLTAELVPFQAECVMPSAGPWNGRRGVGSFRGSGQGDL